jgi:hypothetical protein
VTARRYTTSLEWRPSGNNFDSPELPLACCVLASVDVPDPHSYPWKHVLANDTRHKLAGVWSGNRCSEDAMSYDIRWRWLFRHLPGGPSVGPCRPLALMRSTRVSNTEDFRNGKP